MLKKHIQNLRSLIICTCSGYTEKHTGGETISMYFVRHSWEIIYIFTNSTCDWSLILSFINNGLKKLLIIIKIFFITCSWYNHLLILIILFYLFYFYWRETTSMHFVWHRRETLYTLLPTQSVIDHWWSYLS